MHPSACALPQAQPCSVQGAPIRALKLRHHCAAQVKPMPCGTCERSIKADTIALPRSNPCLAAPVSGPSKQGHHQSTGTTSASKPRAGLRPSQVLLLRYWSARASTCSEQTELLKPAMRVELCPLEGQAVTPPQAPGPGDPC
eukprot:837994-Pelagomonas_calceolata.AAC.1